MHRHLLSVAMLLALALGGIAPLQAQTDPDAWTNYKLNMRAGPGTTYPVVATLKADSALTIAARTENMDWLLAATLDGTQRGWLSAIYLRYREGFAAFRLPVSDEIIPVTQASTEDSAPAGDEVLPPANSELAAYLGSIPVVPTISPRAREIVVSGGNYTHRFSKVGDCNSEDWSFMGGFDSGQYDLGPYGHLQASVDFFRGSFSHTSTAAQVGFNALTMIDSDWADPAVCQAGESSVWCELRTYRPAVLIIMFGPNDVYNLTSEQYGAALRQIVTWSIRAGSIPVLTTLTWCGGGSFGDHALRLNAITVDLAREFDVPLINFWRAAQALPNCGIGADGVHLSTSGPPYGIYLNGDETQAGFTLRSLITLQTLDAIRLAALQPQ